MSLITSLNGLTTRIATEFKSVYAKIGTLASLTTTNKTSLVAAVNEVKGIADSAASGAGAIADATVSTTTTWSSQKTSDSIGAAISGLVNGADTALNTLKEFQDALGDDPNFAATTATSLGNRVRVDTAAQGLTGTQQSNARTNIGAAAAGDSYLKSDIGDPTTNFVTTFESGLL